MDDDDFAAAVEAQIPALRRYAYALTRDHDQADDLVQDCLERALSRRHLRRRDSDLSAWLFTILRNMFLNDRRRPIAPRPRDRARQRTGLRGPALAGQRP